MTVIPSQDDIDYPESDGRPIGETEYHIDEILDLIHVLRTRYLEVPDVYVAGNMLMYYVKGDVTKCVSPDVFLVEGLSKEKRRTYKVWEEGRAPSLVIEVTSESSRSEDLIEKKETYARLGVKEYFLFDPLREYLYPPLQGFRLSGSWYGEIEPDGEGSLISEVTGLRLQVEGERLRLVDLATGEKLLWAAEVSEALQQAVQARKQAVQAREQAVQALQQAVQAREQAARRLAEAQRDAERASRVAAEERAGAAEEEIARLRRELAEARNE
jgi:Uma2 family endonuclease